MKSNVCDHGWRSQYTFKSHTAVKPCAIYKHSASTNDAAPKASTFESSIGKALATVSRIAKIVGLVLIGFLGLTLFIPYMIAEILFDVGSRDDEENVTFHRRATCGMVPVNEYSSDDEYSFTDLSTDTPFGSVSHGLTINPASGLPMMSGDISGFDIGGNSFGMNMDDHC